MHAQQKLDILADSSKYDLACACKAPDEPGRTRGPEGRWIYPAVLPDGRPTFLLKTLQTNHCVNDCSYCQFNCRRDVPRCDLPPEDLARTFIDLLHANRVSGLFLSSGVSPSPDLSMARMLDTVSILRRRYQFRGFVHLKIIPGSSDAAVESALRLATRVSINIETPSAAHLRTLSRRKRYHEDIIRALDLIRAYRLNHNKRAGRPTTQFVVGAAGESDRDIITSTSNLYNHYQLSRVYFSAYQPCDAPPAPHRQLSLFPDMPAKSAPAPDTPFLREHRLYQVDFLFRKYGFSPDEIPLDPDNNLSLTHDPKTLWARAHPEFFPINVNTAPPRDLLRVPGLGPLSVNRILHARRHARLHDPHDLTRLRIRSTKCRPYLIFR